MPLFLDYRSPDFESKLQFFLNNNRCENKEVYSVVESIIDTVRTQGDKALIKLTEDFDNFFVPGGMLKFSEQEIAEKISRITFDEKKALECAAERIRDFHVKQVPRQKKWKDANGLKLGWLWKPIDRVGIYIPGGKASYPSSVLMNAIPAKIAGVKKLVMVTPTPNGVVNPLVLLAARISGVDEIYRIGGAQAVAALAFGTETIPVVDKITGPGNSYVAEAKKQLFGKVGIDMVAGPSEVLIIADHFNKPEWIAMDLLSQAEHDTSAQAILITTSEKFIQEVVRKLECKLKTLKRREIATSSWEKNGAVILVKDFGQAAYVSNLIAPEHLQLCVARPEQLLKKIDNAGSVFIGAWTPEALGDYILGVNHVLPTERAARFSSVLSVVDFMKRIPVSEATPKSITRIGSYAEVLAESEGLHAHKVSVSLRLREIRQMYKDGKR